MYPLRLDSHEFIQRLLYLGICSTKFQALVESH